MKKNAPIEPVLYQIGRPGHGVLNLTEYLYAFDVLMNWIDTKERPQDEECYMIEAEPERNAVLDERGVKFAVSRIDRAYGDIDLNLHSLGKLKAVRFISRHIQLTTSYLRFGRAWLSPW